MKEIQREAIGCKNKARRHLRSQLNWCGSPRQVNV